MKRLVILITVFMSISTVLYADRLYSASWALKSILDYYNQDVGIYTLERQLQENQGLSLEKSIIEVARNNGLYLDRVYLKYVDKDIVNISEPFIAPIEGVYSFINPKGQKFEVSSSNCSNSMSLKDFLKVWDGEMISVPPTGVMLKRQNISNNKQKIIVIYSYHKESFFLFKRLFDDIYREALDSCSPIIYIDELGLIPEESIEKIILDQGLTEKEAFNKARASLLSEVQLIEKGIGIDDPTDFYHKIYDYFAQLNLKIDMEELQYENWKAVVAFDDLNLNQLAVTLFCKGSIDRYLDVIKQYNEGFWQYNVVIRDRFFVNQIERIAEENPKNTIFTLRGLGHFGVDENIDSDKFDVEIAIIGEGHFYKLFVPDQLVQILKRNGVFISPDLEKTYYTRSFLVECLRNYYQNKLNFKISTATTRANKALSLFSDIEIRRLARDIEHAIAEGRLRTTESVYDYVYNWVDKKSTKNKKVYLD